ncbi:89b58ccb-f7e7-45ac-9b71-318dcc3e8e47 [Thermothielavioides terrestris]|uniref:89b58ccb-f7e7-45ac-9b71-318dcc3e8e47 n=1 Tax=Thermothielavioides terrestris TaxID=2587410 RepID=A0A3S4D7R3_9PEZI|nr:89b58ccb-f7e7-45ac-9b71-318dcc3e8e47 [Thermothielavioides terrestris]
MTDTKEMANATQIEDTVHERDIEASPHRSAAQLEIVEPAPNRSTTDYPGGFDKAAAFLKQADHQVVVTHSDSRRVLRRIDWRLMPIMLVIYCLQSLDKNTLSYASVFSLIDDTGLKGDQYSWLGSVVYLAQLVFQPLIAYILVKFPIGKFLAFMVFAWGAILCGMTAAHNFTGLLIARLFLGIFEAAIAPTFVAIVQMWYRRREQTTRNAAWYAMLGIINIFGSLLTYGLGHASSSVLRPYQIIFLFAGCLTVAWSIVTLIFMPDSPMTAKFLKGDDKLIAIERLRMNQQGIVAGVWKWSHVWEALLDVKTWLWFCLMFIISIPSGGISTFGPLIIQSFGFDSFTTILFNIPFGAVQIIATLDPGISPLIYSWSGQNTAGDTKPGNVIGPLLFRPDEKPRYTRGLTANLVLFILLAVLVGLGALWIKFLNAKHAKARVALGKPGKIVDLSMADAKDKGNEDVLNQAADHVGERAFEDLTDLQNEDFIYVY